MTGVDGVTVAILDGLTAYLQSVGALGTYFYKEIPPEPDVAVGVTLYGSVDNPTEALSVYRCQFMFRGSEDDSLSADNAADALGSALNGARGIDLGGGVRLVVAQRRSFIPLPADEARRPLRSDNYALTVNTPPTAFRE